MTASEKKFFKLIALIERIVFSQYAILDQSMLLMELALQAIFRHYHLEQPSFVRWSPCTRGDATSKNVQSNLQTDEENQKRLPQDDL